MTMVVGSDKMRWEAPLLEELAVTETRGGILLSLKESQSFPTTTPGVSVFGSIPG